MDGVEAIPELLVGGIGLENVEALLGEGLNLRGVIVDPEYAGLAVGIQPGVGGAAHSPHAEDNGAHAQQIDRALFGVQPAGGPVRNEVGHPAHQSGGLAIGYGGHDEGHRQGERDGCGPALTEQVVLHGHAHHDEGELAVGRHGQARHD